MPRRSKKTGPKPADERVYLVAPIALVDACRNTAIANGERLSDLIRRGMAREAGKPELAETRGKGKPKDATA